MRNLLIILVFVITSCNAQTAKETKSVTENNDTSSEIKVLLVGTSHWGNYQKADLDVAQADEIDILSDKYQQELDEIVSKIVAFNPTKIFVERTVGYQSKLDSVYNLYKTSDWGNKSRNENSTTGFQGC